MRKKILLVLVLALSLVSVLALGASAETTCTHENVTYMNNADGTHTKECSSCGEFLLTEAHSNIVYGNAGEFHYEYCGVCNCEIDQHDPKLECFPYSSTQHQYKCIAGDCDVVDRYEAHGDTVVKYSADGHYTWCNDCYGKISDTEAHTFVTSGNTKTCSCGYSVTATCAHERAYYESEGLSTHIRKCDDCGETIEQSTSHEWNDGVVTKQPTETENGVKTFTCYACGDTKTQTLYVSGTCTCTVHEAWSYADCGAEGHKRKCPDCLGLYGAIESHDFSKYSEYNGESHFVSCSVCLYTKVDSCQFDAKYIDAEYHQWVCKLCRNSDVEKELHTWDNGKVTKQPTAEENGVRVFTCTVCNGTKTETIDYIDLDKLLENMTQAEATDLYKKIFDKYQTTLVKDGECMKPYALEFVNVILVDIHSLGSRSQYYSDFGVLYNTLVNLIGTTSFEYIKGFDDAMGSVIEKNPVQGLFQGMWSGIAVFYSTIANGVTIGGIALGSIIATVFAIWAVVWLLKAVKKS